MGHGAITKYQVTMTSGATLSAELDLARGWESVYLDVTGAASEVRLQAAASSAGTYRQVYHPVLNSSTVGQNMFKIPSATSGGWAPLPYGLRYLKIETTATVANGLTFTVICAD